MLTKRIIPCLDIKDGRTVKGINFESIRDAGNPIELAKLYSEQGADELVFLDISATNEKRKTLSELVMQISKQINIPFTVGGGINSVEDVSHLLNCGADKISVNTSAVTNKNLVNDLAQTFGSQCVVVAIDTNYVNNNWYVFTNGGKVKTELLALNWAKQVCNEGAGEILLTSMNSDGTKNGFSIDITAAISESVNIPVIASGGAGAKEHFFDVFEKGKADAALAASIFHFNEISIFDLKNYLKQKHISIR